ncbi:MATE family efflux transporter [Bacteroides ovatus]|uniref:polysaccharide biosynthesis C-terminal domain-containing protein n=1 Tax=Bacteroides ovatus TaxID=28116 RepID=UPI0013C37C27|nr:polysaccharide biosynthesis C-terminal domain-containing protein [Bacteroides ovatus]
MSRQIKLGALMSYVTIAVNIISGLVYTPWMISSIGRENFGLYTLALSVITLFVFDFGLSNAVTRFIAKYLAEERQDKANNCIGLVYRLYIMIDIVLFAILIGVFFFIPQIYKELIPEEIEKFKVIYSMVAMYAVVSFPFIPINGVLTAHECFVQLKFCDVLHKLIIVGAMTVCLFMGYGLYVLVMVNALSGGLTIAFKLWCIKCYTPQKISWHYFNKSELKEVAGYSGWVTVIALAQRCIFNLAPSILGALSGSTAIAILGIAMTLEGYTYTFANALNGMFLPKVSRVLAEKNGDIMPLMVKMGRVQIFIVGLIVFGIICFGQDFIYLWVGDGFKDSYLCAVLIILPSLFHLPQMIGNDAIFAANKVKHLAISYVVMAILNLVGAVILSPKFGALGICLSVFIAYMVRTIWMDVIFRKEMDVDVLAFLGKTFGRLAFPMALCLLAGLIINHFIPFEGWIGFIIKCTLFCLAFGVISYTLAMNESEKNLIVALLKKIFKIK